MKKKVYIITVFNSLNSGSFLQATSLYQAIEGMGYEACFVDAHARNLYKRAALEAVFMLKKGDVHSALCKFKLAKSLNKYLSQYRVEQIETIKDEADKNIYVLGSDEIWNLSRKDMSSFPIFWGDGLNKEHCISYAPSLNNAGEDQVRKYEFALEACEKLYRLSVRDRHSYDAICNVVNRDVKQVCDPTLLIPIEKYNQLASCVEEKNYILIYAYSKSLSESTIKKIRSFAKEKGKKLIAFGANYKWCDINVSGSPYDFLGYIKNADYVITSTFHGTLFSSVFLKQFVVVGDKNKKVDELLQVFNLERKVGEKTIDNLIDEEYNKAELKETISGLRDDGLLFLRDSIDSLWSELHE